MGKKLSTFQLGLIFGLLVLIVAGVLIFQSKKENRTFRSVLVEIDTARVTELVIYSKQNPTQPVTVAQSKEGWMVDLPNGKKVNAARDNVNNALMQLLAAKPKRLAGKSKDKWQEFQVDENATRVVVKEGGKTTLDLIIGKFIFNQEARSMSSYVRLKGEEETYVVDGYLEMAFGQGADGFRDRTLFRGKKEEWSRLVVQRPDGTYTLMETEGEWTLNGQPVDKQETDSYLITLQNLMGNEFEDELETEGKQPDFLLTIFGKDGTSHLVKGYQVGEERTVVTSSQNPERFAGEPGELLTRAFPQTDKFAPKQTME